MSFVTCRGMVNPPKVLSYPLPSTKTPQPGTSVSTKNTLSFRSSLAFKIIKIRVHFVSFISIIIVSFRLSKKNMRFHVHSILITNFLQVITLLFTRGSPLSQKPCFVISSMKDFNFSEQILFVKSTHSVGCRPSFRVVEISK